MSHWQHRRRHLQQMHREPVEAHWLGEGSIGQDCLLDTLDASLLALDEKVYRIANNYRRTHNHVGDAQAAVLIPPPERAFWSVGYLSSIFELFLVNDEYDDLQEKASWEFNFRLIPSADLTRLSGSIAVLFNTHNDWHSLEDLAAEVRRIRRLLALEGKAVFALHGVGEGECTHLVWIDGQVQELKEILEGESLLLPKPSQAEFVSLQVLHSGAVRLVPAFLKRNRKFFGNGIEKHFYDRLNESGFLPAGEAAIANHWAILLSWDADAEGKV